MQLKYFISLILFTNFSYAQSTEFVYELKWRPDTTKIKTIKRENMVLKVLNDKSYFQSLNYRNEDKIQDDFQTKIKTNQVIDVGALKKNITNFNYIIFKEKGKIRAEERILKINYSYIFDFDPSLWTIEEEQDSVLNFLAQKATIQHNGRKFEAWFTPEIPIDDGPYIFHGLPGLIVKVQDSEKHYSFTLKEINKSDNSWPKTPKDTQIITFDRVSLLKKKVRQTPGLNPSIGNYFSDEELYKLAQKDNNPLERNQ